MKEMTIEEKAKLYDKAKARMSRAYNDNRCTISFMNEIFPELKENEDERVRNKLIEFFKGYSPDEEWWRNITQEDILAWLEKHSEQKTVDEIAKEVCKNKESATAFLKSADIINEKGELAEQCRQDEQKPTDKKGMNLVEEEMTPFQKEVFCIIDTTIEEEQGLKQVCDKLFALASNEIKQKSPWSEEDEKTFSLVLKNLYMLLDNAKGCSPDWVFYLTNAIQFIKSLKDRYTWKPCDEQMETLEYYMHTLVCNSYKETLFSLYQDLKKLRGE